MTFNKNLFSYGIWFFYAGISIALLAVCGYLLVPSGMSWLWGMLVFPIGLTVYFLMRFLSEAVRKKMSVHPHTVAMWECFLVLLTFAMSVVFQIKNVSLWLIKTEQGNYLETFMNSTDAYYFNQAMIRGETAITPMTHVASYLYVALLSVFLTFLGNKLFAALALQLVLQILAMVLCYFVARRMAGRLPAFVVLLVLSVWIWFMDVPEPEPSYFVFLVQLAGVFCITGFTKYYCKYKSGNQICIIKTLLLGVLLGALLYFDFSSILLWIFLIGLFTGKKEADIQSKKKPTPVLVFCLIMLCAASSFLGLIGILSMYYGKNPTTEMEKLYSLYVQQSRVVIDFWSGRWQTYYGTEEKILICLTVGLASFLIFEFYRNGKEQNFSFWMMVSLLIAPVPFLGFGVTPSGMFSLFVWTLMAGLGLQNCLFGGKQKVLVAMLEEINEKTEDAEEKAWEAIEKEKEKTKTVEKESKETESMYLPNPLPLPKKHVKKQMDYQYTVEEKDMKYDIEVDSNDDFDID